jgi:hypothetical protein
MPVERHFTRHTWKVRGESPAKKDPCCGNTAVATEQEVDGFPIVIGSVSLCRVDVARLILFLGKPGPNGKEGADLVREICGNQLCSVVLRGANRGKRELSSNSRSTPASCSIWQPARGDSRPQGLWRVAERHLVDEAAYSS